jgi:hypothetical protein
MRYTSLAVFVSLAASASAVAAQGPERDSAIGSDLSGYGGFIGLDTRFGDMMDDFAVFMGAHAALLLKHRVYLGLSGAGLITNHYAPSASTDSAIDMGYGGLLIGYVIPMPGMIQLTADATIGAGGVKLAGQSETDDEEWDELFVFEPGLSAEIRLARIVRLGLVGYRYVGAVDTPGLTDADLRGLSGTANVRLGWF